ncbi:MAG: SDR family oxidoreductase, partial [Pseudomonadota bacterium]
MSADIVNLDDGLKVGRGKNMKGRVVLITGASRGIGATMAKLFAQKGAKIGVVGKTQEPHPKLAGTIHSVVQEIQEQGGQAIALPCDVRDEVAVQGAIDALVAEYGGIDVLVNNASAIQLSTIQETDMKRFDLMMSVNMRGTFLCSKLCLPHLMQGKNPHILTMSPPLNMNAKWFRQHLAYTMSKYGMSMNTLGLSAMLKGKISVKGGTIFNIKDMNADISLGCLNVITGVSGSGKSSFMYEILHKNLEAKL